VGLWLAIGLAYRDTLVTMAGIWWRSETFAHCMLVPPIALWLAWRQRARLAAMTPRPQYAILLPLFGVAALWLLAELMVVNAATQFAVVTLLILAVPAVLGLEIARALLFPLLFLYFSVPFGEFMVPTLMEWTADFTVGALQFTGVPVYREGQHFVIPSGHWSVIDECSGVRYVMASFMVGSLFAYLNYSSYRRRAAMMLVALVLPVVANWFRAYMIVMLAHLSGNRLAVGVDHILYGWVFFGIIIFAMFMIGARWSQPEAEGQRAARAEHPPKPAGAMLAAAVASAAVALAPPMLLTVIERAEGQAAGPSLQLPEALGANWRSQAGALPAFEPQFANPSLVATRVYAGPKGAVGVHLAYFRGQDKERKLVSSSNMLVGMRDSSWNIPSTGVKPVQLGDETLGLQTADILERRQGSDGRSQLRVWRLYWVDGRFIAGDLQAKLAGMVSRLLSRGDDGALILLYADAGSPAASDAVLGKFALESLPGMAELLTQVRDRR
jgi:exosortase A